jgi:hypothetical protein
MGSLGGEEVKAGLRLLAPARLSAMSTDVREATEREVVLAFLRAEIDSPRFADKYVLAIRQLGEDRGRLIDDANLKDDRACRARRQLLGIVRGFGQNAYLFQGFPADVEWKLVEVPVAEFGRLKYANHPTWIQLSAGTRLVVDGARNVDKIATGENANVNIQAVGDLVSNGREYPELIAVESGDGFFILVEGHTRATAYALVGKPVVVRVFIGSSQSMKTWAFY